MAETKRKGDLAEAMVMADALRRGHQVAIPMGEDWRFDLIVCRNNKLEKVQCKYTESDGEKIVVRCRSVNNWSIYKYTKNDIDWLAVYDETTEQCYYVPSNLLGDGKTELVLRLKPTKNKQKKGVRWAKNYTKF